MLLHSIHRINRRHFRFDNPKCSSLHDKIKIIIIIIIMMSVSISDWIHVSMVQLIKNYLHCNSQWDSETNVPCNHNER